MGRSDTAPYLRNRYNKKPRLLTRPGLLLGAEERIYSSSPSPSSAGTGVSVPKRPCSSSAPPAVKNSVSDDPAPPLLPKVSDQRPGIVTSLLSGVWTKPMKLLVKPLKAAIQPLRKLPTRMVLLNSPKSRGVQTTPQGAFKKSPCSRRPWSSPLVLKMSTKPKPSPPTGSWRGPSCLA